MAKEHKPNPALTFINVPEEEEKKQSNMVYGKEKQEPKYVNVEIIKEEKEPKQMNVEITKEEQEPKQLNVQISDEEPKKEEGTPRKKKGYRTVYVDGKPVEIESKSKRLQLLITPTLHTKAKKQAKAEGLSLNELFNKALAEYLEEK